MQSSSPENNRAGFTFAEIMQATQGDQFQGPHYGAVRGISIDSRTVERGQLFLAIRGPRFDGHDFVTQVVPQRISGVMVGKWPLFGVRVPANIPVWRVADTWKALRDLAHFHRRRFELPTIAITGSSGKTTTKAMLSHILSGQESILCTHGTQNNQIGTPLTLLRLNAGHRVAVLEIGTNRWGEIRRLTQMTQPTMGVVTNIGPAHLETFSDLRGVLRAKGELWEEMDFSHPLVLNGDDPLLQEVGPRLPHPITWFGEGAKADLRGSRIELHADHSTALINGKWSLRLALPGRHNLMNGLAALACVQRLGRDVAAAVERLSQMTAVPGRLTLTEWEGCRVLDDSYNANPASLRAALEVFARAQTSGRRIAVIGDMLELGPQAESFHEEAGWWVAGQSIDYLLTVGPLGRRLLSAAWEAGLPRAAGYAFATPEEAGEYLIKLIQPNDLILLKGSRGTQMERVLKSSTISSIP